MQNTSSELDEFVDLKQARQCTGLGTTTLYQWAKTGAFPKPIKLGSATRWSKREIMEWQARRLETRGSAA